LRLLTTVFKIIFTGAHQRKVATQKRGRESVWYCMNCMYNAACVTALHCKIFTATSSWSLLRLFTLED